MPRHCYACLPQDGEAGAAPTTAEQASHLLQAVCIRSGDGRRRIISELVATLLLGSGHEVAGLSDEERALMLAVPGAAAGQLAFVAKPGHAPPAKVSWAAYLCVVAAVYLRFSCSLRRQAIRSDCIIHIS